ncbi:MAG TPA: peptidase C14, caspase catalytic subunit p20, partial [Halieaceae bacterium]|nr:peptidase C14, caspase catalytic subunit p20 [Halieaceae bacterium]
PDSTIAVRYRDLRGSLQGPYSFEFKGKKQSEDANQRVLEATTTSWVSFRDYDGKRLLYFTHLMSYRGSIEKIQYGLNAAQPNKNFRFPPWRKPGLAPIDAKTPAYITVPRSTRYVTVQLTYKNGEKSTVQRFDYPG